MSLGKDLVKLIDSTLRFEYSGGAVTHISNSHSTGRRIMPWSMCSQLTAGPVIIEIPGKSAQSFGHGDALVIPEGVPHKLTLAEGAKSISRWAHFRLTVFDTVDALSFYQMPTVIKGSAARKAGDICQELAEILNASEEDLTMECLVAAKSLGFLLASIIFQNSRAMDNFKEMGELYQRLSPTLKYLREEHPDRISLNRMARMSNLSVSRFSTLFRKAMGVSPVHYQMKTRIKKESGSPPKLYRLDNRTNFNKASF
ncbi:MAG: AraC family transcriptional regulator [Lentisphaerae bacterium]|nr:AraC family transcriptional regulator [Lentisphaerota bacterium]